MVDPIGWLRMYKIPLVGAVGAVGHLELEVLALYKLYGYGFTTPKIA